MFGVILIALQAGLIVKYRMIPDDSTQESVSLQMWLTIFTLLAALYLLCFRLPALEPTAERMQMEKDRDIDRLAGKAAETTKSKDGEEL